MASRSKPARSRTTGAGSPWRPTAPFAAALALGTLGCAAEVDGEPSRDGELRYDAASFDLHWFPCSLYEGADDSRAECADAELPLDWFAPDGPTLTVRAKRLLADEPARAQLWLLHGGPGASGVMGFGPRMERMQTLDPELDVYTLDHRGTGYSARLRCPEQEDPQSAAGTRISDDEMSPCMQYLATERAAEIRGLTTTFSGADLAALIHATREPDREVFVWGGSYGTYWGHRYLQIAPDQAAGVVLEGIAPADTTVISQDEYTDLAAAEFMARCGADSFCAAKLGPDPWATLGELLDRLEQSHCPELRWSPRRLSAVLAYLLYYHPTNSAVPAVVYRLLRCEEGDAEAIAHLYDSLFGADGVWDIPGYSLLLQYHVTLSELWHHADFADVDLQVYFDDMAAQTYVARNAGSYRLALRQQWPIYTDEVFDDRFAQSDTPLLMLQGELDPITTRYRAASMGEHFRGAHQHYVSFRQAPHNVSSGTPLSYDDEPAHCATQLFMAFLKAPQAVLDTSCVARVVDIDFRGNPLLSQTLFGTSSFWSNTVRQPAPAADATAHDGSEGRSAESSRAVRAYRRRLRQQLAELPPPLLPPGGPSW